jgi:predicted dehydrogenase
MRPVRIALLGCGRAAPIAGRVRHGIPGVRYSFASRDGARAAEARRRLGGVAAYQSYDYAIETDEVDAVYVATPPFSHLDLALRALREGKHVVIEKPAVLRASDFDELVAAAARAGRQVMVAENYFYRPVARTLRRVVAEGWVGEPQLLQVNALEAQPAEGWRGKPALCGGGALFEGGIHWIDLLAQLGPRIRCVEGFALAHAAGVPPRAASERAMLVVARYETGLVATLTHSWVTPSPLRGLRVSRLFGTRGSIVFESNGLFALVWGLRKGLHLRWSNITGRRAMFGDFIEAIRANRPPEFTLGRARRDHEIVEAAYRSAGIPLRAPGREEAA